MVGATSVVETRSVTRCPPGTRTSVVEIGFRARERHPVIAGDEDERVVELFHGGDGVEQLAEFIGLLCALSGTALPNGASGSEFRVEKLFSQF